MMRLLLLSCLAAWLSLGPALARAGEADAALKERIERSLRDVPVPGAAIRVTVSGGDVLLVLDVDNEIRVAPRLRGTDRAIEREIRGVLSSDARFVGAQEQIAVDAGEVVLRALIPDPAAVLALRHRVAAIEGVVSIEIEPLLVALLGGRT